MKKSKWKGNKLKQYVALLMAIVIGVSSINLTAFAEETVWESETDSLKENETNTVETAKEREAIEESEAVGATEEILTMGETETIVESGRTEEEKEEIVGEEFPLKTNTISDAGTEKRIPLVLNEVIIVDMPEMSSDDMIQLSFIPEESGRYCIEVEGDMGYYNMLLGLSLIHI